MKLGLSSFLVSIGLFVAGSAIAQSTFGTFVGTVQDQSGSVIPDATVTVTNLDTAATRTGTSSTVGQYEFLNMQPGRYSITAVKAGFANVKVDSVALDSRQERRVDLTMGLAAVQQSVVVTTETATVNTENANIANTMNSQAVTDLPMNYRGASTSSLGAIVASANVQQDQNGNIALTGSLPYMTDYSVDGTSSVNILSNSPGKNLFPSTEMLSEFKVSAISNNAELESSGDVTVTTKSGSNTIHGSAFEYLQNRDLDATTYGSSIKQAKVWNTFGGSLSGPIVIPKVYNGHDKTFFFIDYEGNRHPGSQLVIDSVPTAAMRAGDLNGVPGKPGVTIKDPFSGLPFQGNQIPQTELNPVAQKLLTQYYPLPNYNSGSTTGNYRFLLPLANQTDGFDIRVDQYIGSKNQLYGRFTWKDLPYQVASGLGQLLPPVSDNEADRNVTISDNETLTPHSVNEFRFGFSYINLQQSFPFSGASAVANLGLQGLDLSNAGNDGGFPRFNFSSATGFSQIGHGDVGPTQSQTAQYVDNISWIKGTHTIKAGIDFRRVSDNRVNTFGGADEFGSMSYNGSFSGNAFADLLLGLPSQNLVYVIGPHIQQVSQHFATYIQDEWRVTNSLTFSYGLRWELQPPFLEKNGNVANFDPSLGTNGGLVYPDIAAKVLPPAASVLYTINACPGVVSTLPCSPAETASQAGLPQGLVYTYWYDFDPRVSLAWRPFGNDKTVFRAGWGIFTVPRLGSVAYQMAGTGRTNSPAYVDKLVNGQPLFQLPEVAYGNGGLVPSLVGSYTFDVAQQINSPDPQSAQWNVTIERQILNSWVARVSYIGQNSYRLPIDIDPNSIAPSTTPYNRLESPYPQWSSIYQLADLANSNYQNLEGQLTHRMSSGLYLQATYDLAKSLGDDGNDAPTAFGGENGNNTGPLGIVGVNDRFDMRLLRGNDAGIRRQRFLLTGVYQLPFGRNQKLMSHANFLVNGLLGGWQISAIALAETGPFMTPYDGTCTDSQANLNECNRPAVVRPDRIGNCDVSNPSPTGWFNLAGFVPTPAGAGRIGNSGVGICEGPGTVTISGGLAKTFPLRERARLRFEATFTNILNHPNFAPPASMDISSPSSFGVTQTVQTSENGGNRVGQLSLRLDF